MAIPLSYNLRSLRVRWASTIVAVLGIAGTVGVFVAMMSLAKGFKATLVASGSPRNVLVRRALALTSPRSVFCRIFRASLAMPTVRCSAPKSS